MEQTKQEGTSPTVKNGFIWGDKVLWIIIAILLSISVLVVYSSTAKMAYGINSSRSSFEFLRSQFGFLLASLVVLFFGSIFINIKKITKYTLALYIIFFVATIAAGFFGSSTNGAARWLNIGPISFQPSEGLKLAVVLHLAKVLANRQGTIRHQKIIPSLNFKKWATKEQSNIIFNGFIPILLPIILACVIILPAHTSSAILVFGISFLIMGIGCVQWRELFKIVAIAVVALMCYKCMGLGRSDTAGGRVETWTETWTTDRTAIKVEDITDTERSMIAINNGGLFGVGAGQSAMRVEMIHPESDYAFAFYIEEYGLILAMMLLMLYLWIFSRAINIYERSNDKLSQMVAISLGVLIIVQALLHFMVSINFIPETGQILPFVSRGGTSMLFTASAFMLLICISRDNERSERERDIAKAEALAARKAAQQQA